MKKILLNLQLFGDESDDASITDATGDSGEVDAEASVAALSEDVQEQESADDEKQTAKKDTDNEDGDTLAVENEAAPTGEDNGFAEKHDHTEDDGLPYYRVISEAELLSEKVGGFDLSRELLDPSFWSMLKCGLSMETAYKAVHFDELMEAAVKEARERTWREALVKMRHGGERPVENGASGQTAYQSRAGVENLTGRGIREILRKVENGAKIKF